MPAVIHPRRMGDADLAQHLRREVQDGQRLVIAFDISWGQPLMPAVVARLCILLEGPAKALRDD